MTKANLKFNIAGLTPEKIREVMEASKNAAANLLIPQNLIQALGLEELGEKEKLLMDLIKIDLNKILASGDELFALDRALDTLHEDVSKFFSEEKADEIDNYFIEMIENRLQRLQRLHRSEKAEAERKMQENINEDNYEDNYEDIQIFEDEESVIIKIPQGFNKDIKLVFDKENEENREDRELPKEIEEFLNNILYKINGAMV